MDTNSHREVKSHLFLEVLQSFKEARLAVTGTSMVPAIWPGDVLEIRCARAREILPGELVLYQREGGYVAHRVVEKVRRQGRILLVTRGDRLRQADPPVSPDEVLGLVTGVVRGNRRVNPRLTLSNRLAAWFLARSELATRVVLRRKMAKGEEGDVARASRP